MHYVYKITNKTNGHYYIGKRKCPLNVTPETDLYMGSGKLISRAIKRYGRENFLKEILFKTVDSDECAAYEAVVVNETTISDSKCYNMKIGGWGGWDHIKHGFEFYSKMGKKNWSKGLGKMTYEDKSRAAKKAAKTMKARGYSYKPSKEIREKISKGVSGKNNGSYGTKLCVRKGALDKSSRQRFKTDCIPDGWITCHEWDVLNRKDLDKPKRRWYNDGHRSYLRYEHESQGLKIGRL